MDDVPQGLCEYGCRPKKMCLKRKLRCLKKRRATENCRDEETKKTVDSSGKTRSGAGHWTDRKSKLFAGRPPTRHTSRQRKCIRRRENLFVAANVYASLRKCSCRYEHAFESARLYFRVFSGSPLSNLRGGKKQLNSRQNSRNFEEHLY